MINRFNGYKAQKSKCTQEALTQFSNCKLILLSHFSRVRLCATPQTAAHQAPPSLGISRQEHWSGCHFLLQCMKVKSESEVAQSCLTPSDPTDCSLPGSSAHGIFQARVLEWVAIAFSKLILHSSKQSKQIFFLGPQPEDSFKRCSLDASSSSLEQEKANYYIILDLCVHG